MLGEHALLATWATQAGVSGGKNFPALAKQLDSNRVEISQAIGSLYGAAAAKQFLNGKNLWRAHINDFVAYTVATAKGDKAGQKKAVTTLLDVRPDAGGVLREGDRACPKQAAGQRPDRARPAAEGRARQRTTQASTARRSSSSHGAYEHMYMTGGDLAGGIAKQKGLN